MKTLCLLTTLLCSSLTLAQDNPVKSGVYNWKGLEVVGTETGEMRPILEGVSTPLGYLQVHAETLESGFDLHAGPAHGSVEELIIVKEGVLAITLKDETYRVGPGSVAVIYPGDTHVLKNEEATPATYFLFEYTSKDPVDLERGEAAGGSFVVDWNDVEMQETATGGRRQQFDRPTSMFKRLEMHTSTLKEDLTNHAAHTHGAEEFVVIIKSDVEMLIGDVHQTATTGDVIFLASMIPHALNNIGTGETEYFAFQWQ